MKLSRELVLDIAAHVPTPSLSHLTRTCQSLHVLLMPTLISRITTNHLASEILLHGIQQNYLPTIHLALIHKANWHTYIDNGTCVSAILEATKLGNHTIITTLIVHYGPAIFVEMSTAVGGQCHQSPLAYALHQNDLVLTTLLLESGAPANRDTCCWLMTPLLTIAVKQGTVDIVEKMILHGADLQFDDRPLYYAVLNKKWDTAKVLLREGAKISKGVFRWSRAASIGRRTEVEVEVFVAGAKRVMK